MLVRRPQRPLDLPPLADVGERDDHALDPGVADHRRAGVLDRERRAVPAPHHVVGDGGAAGPQLDALVQDAPLAGGEEAGQAVAVRLAVPGRDDRLGQ
jgi:hypothetical protein